jgi:hypothetical protein
LVGKNQCRVENGFTVERLEDQMPSHIKETNLKIIVNNGHGPTG